MNSLVKYLNDVLDDKQCPLYGRSVPKGTVIRHYGRCKNMSEIEYGKMLLSLSELVVRRLNDNVQAANGNIK